MGSTVLVDLIAKVVVRDQKKNSTFLFWASVGVPLTPVLWHFPFSALPTGAGFSGTVLSHPTQSYLIRERLDWAGNGHMGLHTWPSGSNLPLLDWLECGTFQIEGMADHGWVYRSVLTQTCLYKHVVSPSCQKK
jgi:hypothetical protein